ncbi:MAG: pirin family protein, partial [Sciscionella sp.]
MPAVTVPDLTVLAKVVPEASATPRPVLSLTSAPSGFEGEGFPVRRAFAGVPRELLDPFVHMDQMGEVEYAPGEPKGTAWHPHRGFETVTYMIDGTFAHQDSHGGGGVITDGATQWMTAGGGILHIETPPEDLVMAGGLFHGLQLWVNLPAKDKFVEPRYQAIEGDDTTLVTSADGGALIRIIAGQIDGHGGPGATHTPITVAHATVRPGAQLSLPWNPGYNALAYVLSGNGFAGSEGRPVRGGQLVVFGERRGTGMGGAGGRIMLRASDAQDSNRPALELFLLGGRPIREPVAHYGPFVMNTRQEIIQAMEDYQAGRLGTIPAERLPHTDPGENAPQ